MRRLRREPGSLGEFEHYAGVLENGMACLFARGERGSIRIGFNSSASFNPFVPEAISRYRASHPDVQLVLNEKATSALLGDLPDRRLDVAFLRPTTGETAGLRSEHPFDERMMITLPQSHRLAKRSRPSLLELAGEPFIMYPRTNGSAIYDAIIAACQNAGFSPRIAQEAPQISTAVNLVATGIGVALVPESMSHLQTHRVVYRPIAGAAPRATLSLAVRGGPTSAALESFLTTVRTLVAEQRATNARGSRKDRRA